MEESASPDADSIDWRIPAAPVGAALLARRAGAVTKSNRSPGPLNASRRVWRTHLAVLALLTASSLALTWPLVLHLTTHVPGDGIDDPALAWNLWWVKTALVDRQLDPFQMHWMFYPLGINLAFYTLTVFNAVLGLPIQLASSVILTNNLLLLASFVIGGYGAFLLALEVLRPGNGAAARHLPALLGAVVFTFASSRLFYVALGQVNIVSGQWIPFCALYLVRLGRAHDRRAAARNGALAGLFLAMQLWTEMTFASFLLLLVGMFAVWWLGRSLLARGRRPHATGMHGQTPAGGTWLWLPGLLVLAAVVLLAAAPLLAGMLPDLQAEGDFFTSGGGFAGEFSADLRGFLQPNQLHPLFGRMTAALPFAHEKGQHLFWGYTVVGLALLGLWTGRRRPDILFWGIVTGLFVWLTLGPSLRVNGIDTGLPGPFALLQELPFFKGNRYPSRYSVMVLLGLAVLAAAGVEALLGRWDARRTTGRALRWRPTLAVAAIGLTGLIVFEHLAVPLPLTDLTVPAVYRHVANEPGDFTVLEVPLGLRNGARVLGKKDVLIMRQQWYQTAHGQRLVGGNTSRNPPFKFQYFSQAPVLSTLIGLTNANDEPLHTALRQLLADPRAWQALLDHDRPRIDAFLRQFDVRFMAVHERYVPDTVRAYLEALLPLTLVATEDDIRLYRVDLPAGAAAASSPAADFATPEGTLYLGEGWSGWVQPPLLGSVWSADASTEVWAERSRVRLLYPLSPAGGELTLELRAPGPAQRVRVEIGGWQSAPQAVGEDWQAVTFAVPPGVAPAGLNDIDLVFDRLYPVETALASVGAGSTAAPVAILVESAGEETGDFAHIWVNGSDVAPRPAEPGYQVVVIDPATGAVTDRGHFDTLADPAASAALARFVAAVPAGHWVAVAAGDDASLALQPVAVDALRSIGAVGDLRGRFRWGHAILGTKGAAPGTALESMGALQPVSVFRGGPWHSPQVAAGLRTLNWNSAE
jgi:hypothetical protein